MTRKRRRLLPPFLPPFSSSAYTAESGAAPVVNILASASTALNMSRSGALQVTTRRTGLSLLARMEWSMKIAMAVVDAVNWQVRETG